ncbi:hypothetical protein AcV7_005114 [Taiwanofungus camphoratus]|nr:hypothetical protein AcV7_005114 [Antrodia cinnamomea]
MPLAMHAIASQEYLHSRMNKIEEAMSFFSSSTSTPLSAIYFVYLFKIESLAIIFLSNAPPSSHYLVQQNLKAFERERSPDHVDTSIHSRTSPPYLRNSETSAAASLQVHGVSSDSRLENLPVEDEYDCLDMSLDMLSAFDELDAAISEGGDPHVGTSSEVTTGSSPLSHLEALAKPISHIGYGYFNVRQAAPSENILPAEHRESFTTLRTAHFPVPSTHHPS